MKNLIYLILCLGMIAVSCQEEFDFEEDLVFNNDIRNWQCGQGYECGTHLPWGVNVTNGLSFQTGETVSGFLNALYERSPHDDRRGSTSGSGATAELHLFDQLGNFIRIISEASISQSTPYPFDWTIPSNQASGIYRLDVHLCSVDGASTTYSGQSNVFEIVSPDRIEITNPVPWENSYEQGQNFPYSINFFCSADEVTFTTQFKKGNTVIYERTLENWPVPSNGLLQYSAFRIFNPTDYPVGTDYSFVVEMECNGNTITHVETFAITESGGGASPGTGLQF